MMDRRETEKRRVMGKFEKQRADTPKTVRSGDGSFIAAGCMLDGDFTFSGPLTIAGEIKGTVRCEGLIIIEEKGRLEGTVEAAVVIVHGSMAGNIRARESLEIWSGAQVGGKVAARSVRVDEGSVLTADMVICADLPPAVPGLAVSPAQTQSSGPPVPGTNRPASPLPGSGLARRLASLDDQ